MVLKPVPKYALVRIQRALRRGMRENTPDAQGPQLRRYLRAYPTPVQSFFAKLKSADHRKPDSPEHRYNIHNSNFRVRQLNLKNTGALVIKESHFRNGKEDVKFIRRMVHEVNSTRPTLFILKAPKGAGVGPFVVTRKTHFPSIIEILGNEHGVITRRGKLFLAKLAKRQNLPPETVRKNIYAAYSILRTTASDLIKEKIKNNQRQKEHAPIRVDQHLIFLKRNILVIGYENGKPVFVPLIDPY